MTSKASANGATAAAAFHLSGRTPTANRPRTCRYMAKTPPTATSAAPKNNAAEATTCDGDRSPIRRRLTAKVATPEIAIAKPAPANQNGNVSLLYRGNLTGTVETLR